jgi:hypothetical protein
MSHRYEWTGSSSLNAKNEANSHLGKKNWKGDRPGDNSRAVESTEEISNDSWRMNEDL